MSEPDELYTLRNNFWLGMFQRAVTEGSSLPVHRLSEPLKIECKEFVFRSYIALGQGQVVIDEVPDAPNTPIALQSVKLLARYLGAAGDREMIMVTLHEWLQDAVSSNNPTLQLVAAIIFMHENNTKDALKSIRHGTTMEQLALSVQLYLKMDRPDLAAKQVRLMQQADEDATLTQLSNAWLQLYTGGVKTQEAAYVFEELVDKFGPTLLLLNGLAVANMHLGRFDDAERFLQQALSQGPNDPDTLINVITCFQHQCKSTELVQRNIQQLRTVAPAHPFVEQLNTVEGAFERVAATYAPE